MRGYHQSCFEAVDGACREVGAGAIDVDGAGAETSAVDVDGAGAEAGAVDDDSIATGAEADAVEGSSTFNTLRF